MYKNIRYNLTAKLRNIWSILMNVLHFFKEQYTEKMHVHVYELPLPGDSIRQILFLQSQGHLSSVYQQRMVKHDLPETRIFKKQLRLHQLYFLLIESKYPYSNKTKQVTSFEISHIQKIQFYFLFYFRSFFVF